jgi:hypothetical protein
MGRYLKREGKFVLALPHRRMLGGDYASEYRNKSVIPFGQNIHAARL